MTGIAKARPPAQSRPLFAIATTFNSSNPCIPMNDLIQNQCFEISDVIEVARPVPGNATALIVDSPHSGTNIPSDMRTMATRDSLLASWDAYVDEIWWSATRVGGTLLSAKFHRAYIDTNRNHLDIDAKMLAEQWPTILRPSQLSVRGMGLLRLYSRPDDPLYNRKLSVAEVRKRIDMCYTPYHQALCKLVDTAADEFGAVWHVNCHSMKSRGSTMNVDVGQERPDIVVSDSDGRTANPEFTQFVAQCWTSLGYKVAVNYPYKGGEIVKRYGRPALNQHSIQIEINRKLYMNEATFIRTQGFESIRNDADSFLTELRAYISGQLLKIGPVSPPGKG